MCSAFNGKNILFLDFQSFFETGVFIWNYINVQLFSVHAALKHPWEMARAISDGQ